MYLSCCYSFLFSIIDGQMEAIDGDLTKSMLENTKCYLLDCGAEVFIWVGRVTQVDERKAASQSVEVKKKMEHNHNLISIMASHFFLPFISRTILLVKTGQRRHVSHVSSKAMSLTLSSLTLTLGHLAQPLLVMKKDEEKSLVKIKHSSN